MLAALRIMMLGGCKDKHTSAIDTMVDTLNSPSMQAAEKATGLFTGSNAKINGDSLIIVFEMKPEKRRHPPASGPAAVGSRRVQDARRFKR